MTFLDLTLENVGAFRGKHALDLRTSESRSVVLIGALNGSGKTTLLNAFQIALYGRESRVLKPGQTYQQHLRQLINIDTPAGQGASLELSIDMEQETGRGVMRVQRRWWRGEKNEVREQLTIFNGDTPDIELTEGWETFVATVLPPRLADLFFFDGEKIEALTEIDRSSEIIRKGLYVLLGLDQIEDLRRHLRTLKRRRAATLDNPADTKVLAQLEDRIGHAQTVRDKLAQERAATQNAFDLTARTLALSEEAFRESGGELYQSSVEWRNRQLETETVLQSLDEQMRSMAARELPLLLVTDLIEEAQALVLRNEENATARIILQAVQNRDREYVRILKELGLTKSVAKDISKELERLLPRVSVEAPVNALGLRSDRLGRYAKNQLISLRLQTSSLLEEAGLRKKQLAEIEQALESVPVESQIAELTASLRNAQAAHTATESKLTSLNIELSRSDAALSSLRSEQDLAIQRATSRENVNADAKRVITHIGFADISLAAYLEEVVAQRSSEVAANILQTFRQIARKSELISALSIDPRTCSLSLFSGDGRKINPQDLSAGERQILAFATLNGLARSAGKQIPTLIDSPLGRLDGVHRQHLAQWYFPRASHQTIIFSTDKEVDEEMKTFLEPSLAHSYLLQFDERNNGTAIQRGYFQTA